MSLQRTDYDHRCADRECPYYNQTTAATSCRCHKSREELMFAELTLLRSMPQGTLLSALYKVREALGFNQFYPLSHLETDAGHLLKALKACVPFALLAIAEEKKDEIGNSDLDNEQPVTLSIRTTLGAVREAQRALAIVPWVKTKGAE